MEKDTTTVQMMLLKLKKIHKTENKILEKFD